MSTTIRTESRAHPIARFSTRVHQVLDGLVGSPAWSMTPAEQRAALVDLARAEARLAGLRLRVLAAADRDDIAADSAATSTGAWLAQHTRLTRGAAHAAGEARAGPGHRIHRRPATRWRPGWSMWTRRR